jgi:retinol-binding protein 3
MAFVAGRKLFYQSNWKDSQIMKRIKKHCLLMIAVVCAFALTLSSVSAQEQPKQEDMTIDAGMRNEVIATLLKQLQDNYVFPEVAEKMGKSIQQRVAKKEYDSITSAIKFSETLTANLQEVSHDKHLRVNFSMRPIPFREDRSQPTEAEKQRYLNFVARINYGFEKVERLPGNIGYLDLRGFIGPEQGGETAATAMNFLSNTDALIIDLRKNGGGSPAMVALLCSYLFDSEPVHLNDLYWRADNSTHQWWTLPFVPGKRYIGKDVYILTSQRTFSAAEEFTYNLKTLKRATIIGETTGGGANPGGGYRINEHFQVFVPTGRAINPITKTNWEGTGVSPDLSVPADQALKTAHIMAMKKSLEKATDPEFIDALKFRIEEAQKELDEIKSPKK